MENIKRLSEDFEFYLNHFDKKNPFSGPSDYFYKKVLAKHKNEEDLFQTGSIELIYATLASWGMHRMGPKGPRMNEFSQFRRCITKNKDKFQQIQDKKLEDLEDNLDTIKKLYSGLEDLMKTNSKLVATSKVMHFFLPNLIPPMDREYTLNFFNKRLPIIKNAEDTKNKKKEFEVFEDVLYKSKEISEKIDCKEYIDSFELCSTIPKIIDNGIIGFVSFYKKQKSKK